MKTTFVLGPRETELLDAAHHWRLIGLCFERPRSGWRSEVEALAASCSDAGLACAARAVAQAREGDYLALFGPGGPVSPREAGYRRTTDPAKLLCEVRACYEAFGYHPSSEDPIDHVAVLAGFAGWMQLKQAYAHAAGDLAAEELTAEAASKFVRAHLATLAEPLTQRLADLGDACWSPAAQCLLARTGSRPEDVEGEWYPEGLAGGDGGFHCGGAGCGADPTDDSHQDPFEPLL